MLLTDNSFTSTPKPTMPITTAMAIGRQGRDFAGSGFMLSADSGHGLDTVYYMPREWPS
jgi:hypothetical protein